MVKYGDILYIADKVVINLTEVFGSGKEPSSDKIDDILCCPPKISAISMGVNVELITYEDYKTILKTDKRKVLW